MKLDWPGFQLKCHDDGRMVFVWPRYGRVDSRVKHCTRIQLLPQGSDGLAPWLFHLCFPEGPTPGLLVVRVDVPADRLGEAEQYTDLLRRHYRIPEHLDDVPEETGLRRVPQDTPEWIAAPVGAASEELLQVVMARVDSDTG